jgi:hypothetical protein
MDNRPRRKNSKNQSSPEQDFIEAFFRGLWQVISFVFKRGKSGPGKGHANARLAEIRTHWEDVELHVLQPATQSLAISEADKLLDASLEAIGISGGSMGERLKAAEAWFPAELYQRIWQAHKLRNALAHEVGATVGSREAQEAVGALREALYRLKVLS